MRGEGHWREREPFGRLGSDLLGHVRVVCRLYLDMDPATHGAEIEPLRADAATPIDRLVVRYCWGPFTETYPVGVCDGRVTGDLIDALARLRSPGGRRLELVYRGARVPDEDERFQRSVGKGIWLRHLDDYEGQLWDHTRYLRHQTEQLRGDPEYPLDLYLDKRWAPLSAPGPEGAQVAAEVLRLLDTDQPRLLLVLGDFGTGKTFLMRKLAVDLHARQPDLVPVLVTMRDLEKGRTLNELLAQHMAANREDPFPVEAFRYLLRRGRIVLLFDGFDELVQRTSFERVPRHLETLLEAADGTAKVVVTSRHQYFATDQAVRAGSGTEIRIFPLDQAQRRELAVMAFEGDHEEAERFLDLIGRIPNLPDLAANPRMLSFMAAWLGEGEGKVTEGELREAAARAGGMTAGALYRLLIGRWLGYEEQRSPVLPAAQRLEAVTSVALLLWRNGEPSVTVEDLEGLVDQVQCFDRHVLTPRQAAQAVASGTLLVRRGEGEFGFIHTSVMEWLVANHVAGQMEQRGAGGALAERELTPLMADFLCDLAGEDRVIAWARRTAIAAQSPGRAAKPNAQLVLGRRGVTVTAANYAGQDLRGRDFAGQHLTGASFAGANLTGAVLHNATLRAADLRGARLGAARLDHAVLIDADLRDADLTQARLVGADLRGARLGGATLRRAALVGATLDAGTLGSAGDTFGAALPGLPAAPTISSRAPVNAVAVSPGGEFVVSGGADGAVRVWDLATGAQLRALEGHSGAVWAVALTPDGQVVSGGVDGAVRVWDLATGAQLRALEGHSGAVWAVALTPDGQVVSGGVDGAVRVWDLATGAQRARLVGLPGGWAVLLPGGAYILEGTPSGLWWEVGLCRFEPGELDPHVPHIRRLQPGALILDAR